MQYRDGGEVKPRQQKTASRVILSMEEPLLPATSRDTSARFVCPTGAKTLDIAETLGNGGFPDLASVQISSATALLMEEELRSGLGTALPFSTSMTSIVVITKLSGYL
eukprot:scpid100088/ scgid11937/ 